MRVSRDWDHMGKTCGAKTRVKKKRGKALLKGGEKKNAQAPQGRARFGAKRKPSR